jgi:putative ribosome biogenesis GTPase RsgA
VNTLLPDRHELARSVVANIATVIVIAFAVKMIPALKSVFK